jgi:hypothetical protein
LSADTLSKNGKIRLRPINNSNYYNAYNVSDTSSYIETKYSGAVETYFTFDNN